jgi:C4-type Zn-finger protein
MRSSLTMMSVALVQVRSFQCPLCDGAASVVERATVEPETGRVLGWTTTSVDCEGGCELAQTDVPRAG